jgi:hypothetical protein
MILFENIVQVGAGADLDRIIPTVIELVIHAHAAPSGMGGLEAIQGDYSRLAVALERVLVQILLSVCFLSDERLCRFIR